jgi:cob(I)alamin adenosyltransferase
MSRPTRIYTRQGDDGSTRLGGGGKTTKDALRVEAYGTLDELNSHLGAALATGLEPELSGEILRIQGELFALGSQLSFPAEERERFRVPGIGQDHVTALEGLIDRLEAGLEPLTRFILPGGCEGGSRLHLARTVCRRAERLLVALSGREDVDPANLSYLNRLSDALFVMARFENRGKESPETVWKGSEDPDGSS